MNDKIPKTVVTTRPDSFANLGDVKDVISLFKEKSSEPEKNARTHSRLRYVAIVLIIVVLAYSLRGYWLGPILKGRLEQILSTKFQSQIDVDYVKGNYFNHFELYSVSITDSTKDSESHVSKISLYFSFWKMLAGDADWISILVAQDGKIEISLENYLQSGKSLQLPETLPAMSFRNFELAIKLEELSLRFTDFNCTLWSSGRIIANSSSVQGSFSNFAFQKSNFEFDARWRDQLLGIDTMALAGQNTAKDLILDFGEGANSIINILGRFEIERSQIYLNGKLDLSPQKQKTFALSECSLINFDVQPIYSLIKEFPIKEGLVTGNITGILNLDFFSRSNFDYNVEIVDTVVNTTNIPILSGHGNFQNGVLNVDSGNWVQRYDSQIQRRLQVNSLELDISKLSEGKLSANRGEIIIYSDEQFAFLRNLTTKTIPPAQYLLKAVFEKNQVLIFGTLKDKSSNVININKLLIGFSPDNPIDLKKFADNTVIEANIDFNVNNFTQFRSSFPELESILNFEGKANGSLAIKGTTDEGKAKLIAETQNLLYKNIKIADTAEISAMFEWDSTGTNVEIKEGSFHREDDDAYVQGILHVPNTDFDFEEIISKNLNSLNLTVQIADLGYYSGLFSDVIPSGKCDLSLISQPIGDELGLLSFEMENLRYHEIEVDSFSLTASIYRDKIVVSRVSSSNRLGALQGAFSVDFANRKHIFVSVSNLEYFHQKQMLALTQDIDCVIKEDKILINSFELSGNLGTISLSALIIINERYFDIDFILNNINGDWVQSLFLPDSVNILQSGTLDLKGSFQGTTSSFESRFTAEMSEIKYETVPEFNISLSCNATQNFLQFPNISITDFSKTQKEPLIVASTILPVNFFKLFGFIESKNRIFGLDEIKAQSEINLENLNWLQIIMPKNAIPSGNCQAKINVGGTFDFPEAKASVSFQNLDFSMIDDSEFFSFFAFNNSLTNKMQNNSLRNFKNCGLNINCSLANDNITISHGELQIKYNFEKPDNDSDDVSFTGQLALTGKLPQVLLMEDNFGIGDGNLRFVGKLQKISRIPILANIATKLEGALNFDFLITSPWVAPKFDGSAALDKCKIQLFNDIHPISDVSAKIILDGRQIYIFNLKGNSGGARLQGDGILFLKESDIELNMNMYGKSILLKRTENQVLRADLELKILNSISNPLIKGSIKFDDSEYSEYFNIFSDLNIFNFRKSNDFFSDAEIDIKMTSKSEIDINTNFIISKASINLLLKGKITNPKIAGRIKLNSATLQFPALKFYYPSILLRFNANNKSILLSGSGTGSEFGYSVDMKIAGKIGEPEFIVKSKPATNNDEILEMIIFGKRPAKIQPGAGIAPVQKITLFVPKDLLDRIFTIKNQNKDFILERMEVKEFTNYSKNDREMFLLRFYLASPSDETSETFAFELERDKYDTLNMGFAFVIRFK